MHIVDAHLDLAYNVVRGRDVTRPAAEQPIADDEIATVGLPDLRAGNVALICATIFCSPRNYRGTGYTNADEARAQAITQLDWYRAQIEAKRMRFVRSARELPTTAENGQPAILLLEGADALRSPQDVSEWFDQGLRIVGLAWKRTRAAGGTGEPGPLTDEGRALIKAFDGVGIIHDASHLAEESFWQLLELTARPVIATHSNCRSIVPTDRQLSDEMIKAIAARGGVIGMNFYDKFLMPPDEYKKRRCTMDDLIAHIKHICDLTGSANHVGLGSDMDGGLGREQIPSGINTSADLPLIGNALAQARFSTDDVQKILADNWLAFFRRTLPA